MFDIANISLDGGSHSQSNSDEWAGKRLPVPVLNVANKPAALIQSGSQYR